MILDGYHRFKACKELGIEPKDVTRDFGDELHERLFVVENLRNRRHLNDYERGTLNLNYKSIIAEIAKQNSMTNLKNADKELTYKDLGLGKQGVNEEIGKKADMSHEQIRKIERINEKATDADKQKLKSGEMTINKAYHKIVKPNANLNPKPQPQSQQPQRQVQQQIKQPKTKIKQESEQQESEVDTQQLEYRRKKLIEEVDFLRNMNKRANLETAKLNQTIKNQENEIKRLKSENTKLKQELKHKVKAIVGKAKTPSPLLKK